MTVRRCELFIYEWPHMKSLYFTNTFLGTDIFSDTNEITVTRILQDLIGMISHHWNKNRYTRLENFSHFSRPKVYLRHLFLISHFSRPKVYLWHLFLKFQTWLHKEVSLFLPYFSLFCLLFYWSGIDWKVPQSWQKMTWGSHVLWWSCHAASSGVNGSIHTGIHYFLRWNYKPSQFKWLILSLSKPCAAVIETNIHLWHNAVLVS